MAIAILSVSNSNDSLTFSVPGNIIDSSADNLCLLFQRHIRSNRVPDPHRPRNVLPLAHRPKGYKQAWGREAVGGGWGTSRGDIVSRGGESGYAGGRQMAIVLR
jgi:hypothetical protein